MSFSRTATKFVFVALLAVMLFGGPLAKAEPQALTLERVARLQSWDPRYPKQFPGNRYVKEIFSPKSARFSTDGRKVYVNSLEGYQTVVLSWPKLETLTVINHIFGPRQQSLFNGEVTAFDYKYYAQPPTGNPNFFSGKPVESELSHGGKYLWVPYYRRDFDKFGQSPSAVAIIDTETDRIVRVMPTGPIPKYVTASPDGRFVAVTHWGDNTVALIDTSSTNPNDFRYVAHFTVEKQLSQEGIEGVDRDKECGYCLRGTVFTPDSEYLLVARMGQGGIAGFHIPSQTYLGTLLNIRATPRHLVISPDGRYLYASSNATGYVSKIELSRAIDALNSAHGRRVGGPAWKEVFVGKGARTLEITSDGRVLFVAAFNVAELVAIDADSMQVVSRMGIDKHPVGLAVAPDNSAVILTSQGLDGVGGNAVNVVRVTYGSYDDRPAPLSVR